MRKTGIEAARALWQGDDCASWAAARAAYDDVLHATGGDRLTELDRWYHGTFPPILASRQPGAVMLDELVEVVQWKMHRGVFRARNLALVRQNGPEEVADTSRAAFDAIPDPSIPIARLSALRGIGPATASAVLAARRPDLYPFFDDVAAAAIPDFGAVKYTAKEYARYSERLRERATLLATACPHDDWTPHAVECALWAAAGGKGAAR